MKRTTFLVTALVLVLGLTQCKKDQEKPQSKTVNITLEVKGGGNSAKVDVNPNGSPMVTFESGDQILVGYDGKYVGTLTHNGTRFAGTIEVTQNGDQPLYFYFVGNKNKSGAAISVGDATYSVDISDQSAELPVLSFSASNEDFNGAGTYTASLHNQCTLVELTLTSGTTAAVSIGDRYTQATINFGGTPGIVPNTETTGMITTKSESDTKKYAILLPQAAAAGAHIAIGSVGYTLDLPAMNAGKYVQFNDEGAAASNIVYLDYLTTNYEAANGQTLTGTLGANVKISIADGATVTLDGVTINGVNNSSYPWAGINCVGTATIILKDGTTNTVSGFYEFYPGIHVLKNYTLTIQGTGTLNASSSYGAGIGGGAGINCGNIQIESGTINVDSHIGTAAGIGGGRDASCGNITISGGLVTAIGGAAGIGSGYAYSKTTSCGNISITGGTIIATGGSYCAGIGSGCNSNCGAITITSGVTSVTATKGSDAYNSIGKGWGNSASSCGTVTIGGVVYWNGSSYQNGGDTYLPTSPLVYPTPAPSVTDLATITENYTASDGEILTGTLGANVKISIADGATITLNGVTINGTNEYSYAWAGLTCLGDATIILKDGTTNTVKGFNGDYPGIQAAHNDTGVGDEYTLTIQGAGTLTAYSNVTNPFGAGIGGGWEIDCGNIEIQGGTITATGGEDAAGIGSGGNGASCGTITISGGTVTATGGEDAAGIGSGNTCGDITISGGTVEATGGDYGAGIGTGSYASCGNITITSGVTCVTATKGSNATNSIGAGQYGTCGTVTIGGVETGPISTSPYTYPAPAPAATSLSELKTAINGGTDCSSYIGWEVNSAGAIAESGISGTKIGYVAYVSTSDVDAGVSGSRILVIASADAAANTTWGSKGTARGLTADDLNGYSNTNTLQGYGSEAHPAAYAAWNYSATIPSGGATPAHWFMPTKKQWENMRDAKGGTYGAMSTAYGIDGHYWTSTEVSNNNAWRFVTNSNIQSNMESINYNVRSIFAY